ncbi:hypothetical protein CVT25_003951 [Psilocybe cyanescens]|uniref:Alpha-glycerophosphate oxidase C-terminal domain-containing protein n=1 Tax=Psilocybe cyanescens TaxID=93625 RepID=A0A409VX75_PSICY|nr:hypothetical protein CVT25_003951 [Psilocybe cyanescens]
MPCTHLSRKAIKVLLMILQAGARFSTSFPIRCPPRYAQAAIDVLARRTRLSFFNARAALDTLPIVVDIMAQELNWTMGIQARADSPRQAGEPHPIVEEGRCGRVDLFRAVPDTRESFGSGRSKFEAGEVAALSSAFNSRTRPAEDG